MEKQNAMIEKKTQAARPMIRVEHLRKVYRTGKEKVRALDDVSLELGKGEFCCIVGASGSGKSTLLNQLAGLEKPTRGTVVIDGENISAMDENQLAIFRQKKLGFVFQSYNLLPTLTAVENVALPLMFKGVPKKKREKLAKEQLKKMGLGQRTGHKPTEMSGGQQQRVGIARAFVSKPAVVFADEPTGNLDSHTTVQVMNAILELIREYKITFVMVTHERELAACADRIITLRDGKVLRDERIEHPQTAYTAPEGGDEDLNDHSWDEAESAPESQKREDGALADAQGAEKPLGVKTAPGEQAHPEAVQEQTGREEETLEKISRTIREAKAAAAKSAEKQREEKAKENTSDEET